MTIANAQTEHSIAAQMRGCDSKRTTRVAEVGHVDKHTHHRMTCLVFAAFGSSKIILSLRNSSILAAQLL